MIARRKPKFYLFLVFSRNTFLMTMHFAIVVNDNNKAMTFFGFGIKSVNFYLTFISSYSSGYVGYKLDILLVRRHSKLLMLSWSSGYLQ